ncbi:hypothetical protein [Frigoribacterium sp. MEB024]|uniref:hypothetical protein n=1 Tax=Frigoribacterium sp. MEB024 TaxID=1589899 RepID=UPI0012E0A196|nr:hypothetical protein [Frigoribacterium sp. MEB024]
MPDLLTAPVKTSGILEALYRDDSDYVRRSVANHLNDLSRDHPEMVMDNAFRWYSAGDDKTPHLLSRGLRTLVKKGHAGALGVLGFGASDLTVIDLTVQREHIELGDDLGFSVTVRNDADTDARVNLDYIMDYVKANGSLSPKAFKLATSNIPARSEKVFTRKHSFRVMTTRRLHPGTHSVSIVTNGVPSDKRDFRLAMS